MFASYNGQAKPSAHVTSRRKVFDNAMVAHVWAQQTNEEGRSANGNFYFNGATIYSYGSHFPIATFTDATFEGQRVVLFNNESRSVSTGQHQRYAGSALDGLNVKVFNVRSVGWGNVDHSANVAHLVKTFDSYAAHMAKAHVRSYGTDRDNSTYEELGPDQIETARIVSLAPMAQDIRDYCATFNLDCPDLGLTAKGEAISKAFARRYDPRAIAKRETSAALKGNRHFKTLAKAFAYIEGVTNEKPNLHFVPYSAKAQANAFCAGRYRYSSIESCVDITTRQRAAQALKPDAKAISPEQWQNGANGHIARNAWSDDWNAPTLVRRVGDTLETSRGAECPFKHAVLAFLKAQQCRQLGTSWHRNGQQIRVGQFQVDSIDEQGNMTAGCHTLEWSEMLRLAIREVPHLVQASFGLPALLVS